MNEHFNDIWKPKDYSPNPPIQSCLDSIDDETRRDLCWRYFVVGYGLGLFCGVGATVIWFLL